MNTTKTSVCAEAVNRRNVLTTFVTRNGGPRSPIPRLCAFLALLAGLAAQAGTDFSGIYTLITVNGLKLPAKVSHEGAALEIRSGTFTITTDGKCASQMTFLPPSGREATVNTKATYSRQGSVLKMQWQNAGTTTGTVEGNRFTMENEGMVFVYTKSPASNQPPPPR
jgi:hypothetical protein